MAASLLATTHQMAASLLATTHTRWQPACWPPPMPDDISGLLCQLLQRLELELQLELERELELDLQLEHATISDRGTQWFIMSIVATA